MNYAHTTWIVLLSVAASFAAEPVTDPFPDPIAKGPHHIELEKIAGGIGSAVWLTHPGDGSGRLFVVDQAGKLWLIENGKRRSEPVLDVSGRLAELRKGFDERGFLGAAFHPDFAKQGAPGHGKIYTYTSEKFAGSDKADFPLPDMPVDPDNQTVIAEWSMNPKTGVVDVDSRRELMRIDEPQWNHAGGAIVFGPDGMLYLGVGDGGAANDAGPGHTMPQGNAQDLTKVLGKVLRIDPLAKTGKKSANGQYSIPADNPFVGKKGHDEIFAYGLRNPWRMSFTPDGRLIAGDIGQDMIEELDVIKSGGNYGWRYKEGSYYFKLGAPSGENIFAEPAVENIPGDLIDPIAEYDQDEGTSIIAGYVYRGDALPKLKGQYIFGDWAYAEQVKQANGKTKTVRHGGRLFHMDPAGGKIRELRLGADDRKLDVLLNAVCEGPDGELYILTNTAPHPFTNKSAVWKIVPVE